jgi:cytosine/adenosine deaminase-related metal-dependent hydrolase
MIVYPGLVNTHHHLYQYLRGTSKACRGWSFSDWLIALYGIWAHLNEETVRLSSLCGMAELLKLRLHDLL